MNNSTSSARSQGSSNSQDAPFRQIIRNYEREPKKNKFNDDELLNVAASYLNIGLAEQAEEICSELEDRSRFNSNFVSIYGAALRRLGKHKESLEVFEDYLSMGMKDSAVANNYANLLIDIGQFDKAKSILVKALTERPENEKDIERNIARVNALIGAQTTEKNKSIDELDPIIAAFSPEEIEENKKARNGDKKGTHTDLPKNYVLSIDNQKVSDACKSQLVELRTHVNKNPTKVLSVCSDIHKRGVSDLALLYEVAAEAYLKLQMLADAEIAYHSAIALGTTEFATYLNLSNLCAMRSDFNMAYTYLIRAQASTKKDIELLEHTKSILFETSNSLRQGKPFLIPEI